MSDKFKDEKHALRPARPVSAKNKDSTLRDQFAMAAMQGVLSNEAMIAVVIEESAAWVSREAYLMADAMLKARNKQS
ncbi:TPA: hypothetical protein ACW0T4_001543 [Morganella morganii]